MKAKLKLILIALFGLLSSCSVHLGPDGKPTVNVDQAAINQASADLVARGVEKLVRATK